MNGILTGGLRTVAKIPKPGSAAGSGTGYGQVGKMSRVWKTGRTVIHRKIYGWFSIHRNVLGTGNGIGTLADRGG